MAVKNNNNLTDKQLLWAEYYLQTGNATLSARLAGYKGDDNTLSSIGHHNTRKHKIRAHLSERYKDAAMGADEVLALLAKKARACITDFVNESGVIDWRRVQMEGGGVVKSITHTLGSRSKIELESSLKALELIGKYHVLFTEKLELKVDWRNEAEKMGLSASDLFEEMVANMVAEMEDAE